MLAFAPIHRDGHEARRRHVLRPRALSGLAWNGRIFHERGMCTGQPMCRGKQDRVILVDSFTNFKSFFNCLKNMCTDVQTSPSWSCQVSKIISTHVLLLCPLPYRVYDRPVQHRTNFIPSSKSPCAGPSHAQFYRY